MPAHSIEACLLIVETWEMHTDDDTGQQYYYNPVTNETTWDSPVITRRNHLDRKVGRVVKVQLCAMVGVNQVDAVDITQIVVNALLLVVVLLSHKYCLLCRKWN